MAIIWNENSNDGLPKEAIPVGEPCYFCGRDADNPMIYWSGVGNLVLHPGCVVDLTVRLYRDVHEVQQTLEGYTTMITDPNLHPEVR